MKKMRTIILVAALCGLSGCATTNKDPLEGINRGIYKFNDVADRYAMKPVANAYKTVAPSPVRTGISNFFSNLGTLTTVVNDLLQLKFAQAFADAGRFVINTTFGIGGFVDVASMDKIEKHNEDFGQTLGYWGVGSGAYLVLPILGPSTIRDAGGLLFDTVTSDPITYFHNTGQIRTHNQIRAVQLLDKRTQLLDATDLVDNASIDPYAFMRDAYLQRRASQVQDGLVPQELLQDEFQPADDEPAAPVEKQTNKQSDNQSVTAPADNLQANAPVDAPAEATPQETVVTDVATDTVAVETAPAISQETALTELTATTEVTATPMLPESAAANPVEDSPAQVPVAQGSADAAVPATPVDAQVEALPPLNVPAQVVEHGDAINENQTPAEAIPTQVSAVDVTLQAIEDVK